MTSVARPTATTPRRSLVRLAGLVIVLLIVNGAVGLFGLRHAGLKHEQNLDALDRLIDTLDTARRTQAHFKTQVQEWKNTLLRGATAADFEHYFGSFERHETKVREGLEALRAGGERGPTTADVDALLAEHARLAGEYRQALAGFDPKDPASPQRIDRRVRGLDRAFNDRLDLLADGIRQRADDLRGAVRRQTAAREQRIEQISIAGTVVTIALLLLMLSLSTRRR